MMVLKGVYHFNMTQHFLSYASQYDMMQHYWCHKNDYYKMRCGCVLWGVGVWHTTIADCHLNMTYIWYDKRTVTTINLGHLHDTMIWPIWHQLIWMHSHRGLALYGTNLMVIMSHDNCVLSHDDHMWHKSLYSNIHMINELCVTWQLLIIWWSSPFN